MQSAIVILSENTINIHNIHLMYVMDSWYWTKSSKIVGEYRNYKNERISDLKYYIKAYIVKKELLSVS